MDPRLETLQEEEISRLRAHIESRRAGLTDNPPPAKPPANLSNAAMDDLIESKIHESLGLKPVYGLIDEIREARNTAMKELDSEPIPDQKPAEPAKLEIRDPGFCVNITANKVVIKVSRN